MIDVKTLDEKIKSFYKVHDKLIFDDQYFQRYWGADNKEDYRDAEERIKDFEIETDDYTIYLGMDYSGFDYWMVQNGEPNYVDIRVSFESSKISNETFEQLKQDLDRARAEVDAISSVYDYDPFIEGCVEDD